MKLAMPTFDRRGYQPEEQEVDLFDAAHTWLWGLPDDRTVTLGLTAHTAMAGSLMLGELLRNYAVGSHERYVIERLWSMLQHAAIHDRGQEAGCVEGDTNLRRVRERFGA